MTQALQYESLSKAINLLSLMRAALERGAQPAYDASPDVRDPLIRFADDSLEIR